MNQIIMHIDVNNAFLSWSAVDLLNHGYHSDIRTHYAIIGGDETKRKGIVLAKSQLAKEKGIKTAETLYSARKKCPELEVYSPNYSFYQEISRQLFDLIRTYTPDVEVLSIDECYLDYGKVQLLYGDAKTFAYRLKKEIKEKLGFTVNIGIANNKLCAKMASDFQKPNQVHTLFLEEVEVKLWPLAIERLYGIGKQSVLKLHQLHIKTIRDLAHIEVKRLVPYFKNMSPRLIAMAHGIDDAIVKAEPEQRKGIGNSVTLPYDHRTLAELYQVLGSLVQNVAGALRKEKKYVNVISVQLKDQFFKSYSHQRKLDNPTNQTNYMIEVAQELLKEMWKKEPIRLIGVRLEQLTDDLFYQVSLFENVVEQEQETILDQTLDYINQKYGATSVGKAQFLQSNIHKKY